MGYSTDFSGILKFTCQLTDDMEVELVSILGEDCRDHPEWEASRHLSYIDLQICSDGSGLEWDGSEKTYGMQHLVNVVITQMRKKFPEFGLSGKLFAQGEERDDLWWVVINSETGLAEGQEYVSPETEANNEFNRAIDFAISLGCEAAEFLIAWREGDWDSCDKYGFNTSSLRKL